MMKSKITLLISVGIIAIVFAALVSCAAPAQNEDRQTVAIPVPDLQNVSIGPGFICSSQNIGVWVNGEGKVKAVPDIAMLTLGVQVQQKTVAEAQRQAADSLDKVMSVLKSKGVAEKDIQTQGYSISPVTRWDDKTNVEILLGYNVTNNIIVKIRKLNDAGSIIDNTAQAAGNDIRISSISFSVDDPTDFYKQAREKAIKDAMDKAKQIASVSGVKLGKVLYITESMVYPMPIVRNFAKTDMVGAAPEVTTPISGGELEITANIQMVYDID